MCKCDGQQFHQYQQNEQLPLASDQKDHDIGNPGPGWHRYKNVAGLNWLIHVKGQLCALSY